jgi:hypothetical protein
MSVHISALRYNQLLRLGFKLYPWANDSTLIDAFVLDCTLDASTYANRMSSVGLYLQMYIDCFVDYREGRAPISLINRAKARLYREIDYALIL